MLNESPDQKAANRQLHNVDPSFRLSNEEEYLSNPQNRERMLSVRDPYYAEGRISNEERAAMLESARTPEQVREIMENGTLTWEFNNPDKKKKKKKQR